MNNRLKVILENKNKNPYRDKRITCVCGCHDIGMKKCEMCVRIHLRHLSKKDRQTWEENRKKARPYGILMNGNPKTDEEIKRNIQITKWKISFDKRIMKKTIKEKTERIKIHEKYVKRLEKELK